MNKPSDHQRGFALRLGFPSDMDAADRGEAERAIQDRAQALDLRFESHGPNCRVFGLNGPVSAAQQVELIDHLVARPDLVWLQIEPLDEPPDTAEGRDFIKVNTCDMAVVGLALMHRCQRVGPQLYLRILRACAAGSIAN